MRIILALNMRGFAKYRAKAVHYDGHRFSSILECHVYQYLKLLEKSGGIKDLELPPKVYLTDARILLKPDFKVFDLSTNEWIWYEAKGQELATWRIKRKLWEAGYGPGKLVVMKRQGMAGVKISEIITPKK